MDDVDERVFPIGDVFIAYIRYVLRHHSLTNKETIELFQRYYNGDDNAYKEIAEGHLWLVIKCAVSNYGLGVSIEDLIQEGNLGLLRAIQTFDTTKFTNFNSYANKSIYQSIKDALLKLPYLIRLPLNQYTLYQKIKKFKKEYEQEYGYEPPLSYIDIEDEDVEPDDIAILNNYPDDLSDLWIDEDLDSFESDLSLIDDFENEYTKYYLNSLCSSILSKRSCQILQAYFFNDGDSQNQTTLGSLGAEYGLTRERIRQIIEASIRKIRHHVIEKPKREKTVLNDSKNKQNLEWEKTIIIDNNELQTVNYKKVKTEINSTTIQPKKEPKYEPKKESLIEQEQYPEDNTPLIFNDYDLLARKLSEARHKRNTLNTPTIPNIEKLKPGYRFKYNTGHYTIYCTIIQVSYKNNYMLVKYDNGVVDSIPVDFSEINKKENVLKRNDNYSKTKKTTHDSTEPRLSVKKIQWYDHAIAIKWIKLKLAEKMPRTTIIQQFNRYHRLGYYEFSNKTGKYLDSTVLSIWIRELASINPNNWAEDENGKLIYQGKDIAILQKEVDDYFRRQTPKKR